MTAGPSAGSVAAPLIVDAHQHVWDLDRADYPWLDESHPRIRRSIGMDEVLPELRRAGVVGSVLVQSADDAADTRTMLEVAAAHPQVLGVVGWVPLDRPADAAEQLDALPPLVVGIRNLIHDRPDPDWLLRPEVDEGLALLEAAGLPFDLVAVLPRHLELVPILCARHPRLRIVIDHLAKPPLEAPQDSDEVTTWRRLMTAAAESPLVSAKVSGQYLAAEAEPEEIADRVRPFWELVLDRFGPDRLMYGGDWPMSLETVGYATTWRSLAILVDELPDAARAAVLGRTAISFYGLDPERIDAAADLFAREAA